MGRYFLLIYILPLFCLRLSHLAHRILYAIEKSIYSYMLLNNVRLRLLTDMGTIRQTLYEKKEEKNREKNINEARNERERERDEWV